MASKIVMPKMGYDMENGKILEWLKKQGDAVHAGEDVAEIETEKVNIRIQSFADGVLRMTLAQEGDTVPVGEMIAVVGTPDEKIDLEALRAQPLEAGALGEGAVGAGEGGEAIPEIAGAGAPAVAISEGQPTAPTALHKPAAAPEAPQERLKISPLAGRLAAERGVDLRQVQGTGPGGRITRDDVLRSAERQAAPAVPAAPKPPAPRPAPAPARPQEARVPKELAPMRQAIARRMAQSKREAPHFYVTVEIDMTEAMRLRAMLNEMAEPESQISVNDLVVKAVARTLSAHREFNAHIRDERIEEKAAINIGNAIALPEGLIAPALMDCEEKSLAQIARGMKDLVARAKSGGLRPEELTEGTFSITNLGMFGVESFSAIIVPPQVAILAVGAAKPTPVVRNDAVAIAQIMKVTISVDHRAHDGAQAARFLQDLKKNVETPVGLLL